MIRSQLIAKLSEDYPDLTPADVRRLVDTFFGSITDALTDGRKVELRRFGTFTPKTMPPRKRRNPRTGETVVVPESSKIHFKTGKPLRERMNKPR